MLNIEKEVNYLKGQVTYFKEQIDKLEAELKTEPMILETNNNKTMMQNPKVRTLNEYTKNLHSTYTTIKKLSDPGGEKAGQEDELSDFISKRSKVGKTKGK